MPFLDISMKKDSSAHLLSDNKRDLMQQDVKRATSGEISGKEKKFHPTDPQFYKEATAYHDILRLLGKTEKLHVEYATDVLWTTQNLTGSLPPLIFTTTKVSLSTLTFLPYFTEAPIITTTENFTTESVMLLTPFLEETPVSLYTEIVTTEEEAVEGTSLATEITRSPLVETTVSLYLYTLSTVSLFGTTETELTIKTTTEPVSTFFATTTSPQTVTLESIFGENITLYKAESTTAIARSSTILEKTETILSTSTEGMTTTLTPEDESPVAQIEKTITAEETATEIPTTTETLPTEITITTIITTEISTAATEIPTTVEATTITKTSIPTEILTTLKTPVTKEITSAKTLTPTETLTPFKTKTTAQILTSIKTTTFTEILTVNKTVTAGTPTSLETPTASEIPPTSTILTTTKTLETLTTTKIPVKKTTSTLTPTIMEISTESLGTTEISVITTTYVTTKFFTTSESTLSIPTTPKEFFPMSTLTTFTTIFITETTESTLISSITPVSTISAKTAVPTLKLATITPLQTLITNTTLSETPYTTISSTFLTTTKGPVTITFKTAVPTTSLKIITTTPLSLATSTMPGETPNTTLSTFLTEETTASSILTTAASSLETFQTTAVLSIPTTVSTIETVLTTLSITAVNATVSSTTASTITTEIFESTISSLIYFTATTPITTSILMETETTLYQTTSTSVTSSFLTETTEGPTSPIIEYKETTKYEEYYYESTEKEIVTVTISTAELTSEERTTWITAKEITIIEETTPMTSFITPFFIETTTPLETITLPTITEETLLIEKIVTPIIEEISTVSEVILISTETSTMSAIETSIRSTSFILTTAATTASLLEKIATEITETSLYFATLPTTEKPKYATILEAAIAVPLAPFSESILSIIITSETPVTTPEIISTLPEIVSEAFTTESPSITYVTKSSVTLFIETTVHSTVAISIATTEKMLEAETEYYVAKEPFYKEEYEEYEEYDTEVPTGKWYDYEYESTTEKGTTVAVKYTKLPKEKATSPPFIKGTTSSYETETSEFTRYSTVFETTSTTLTTSTYINVTSTAATSEIFYTEEVTSTALETSASTFVSTTVENVTTLEVKTKFTTSAASEEVESTTISLTFGSTEEYTLPSSTTFKIPTEPLEYLTIPPKYTDLERFTHIWRVTSPKFTTKPKEIPEIALKKTTASERVSTETEETAVEKLTSVFVSSAVTTLSEREAFVAGVTTMSTSEIEGIIETIYEVTTSAMTEEEAVTRVTPFITTEIELVFTTTSETVAREEKEQLLQRLDDLRKHEKEMAEREEWLKEKERQWDVEKEKRRKMMQREKEKEKNLTTAGTTEGYITTIITTSITSPVYTVAKNLTISTAEIEVTFSSLEMSTATSSLVEIPTETIPFSTTEEITFVTYTTTQKTTVEEIIFTTYATEETVIPYTTEEITPIMYITEEIEKVQITEYVTLVPYVTTSIVELYNISLVSIETTTPYTIEEMHTTSYMTLYSEPLFASPTITRPITLVTEFTLPIATLSERFEETSLVTLVTTPTWYTTEETYTETYTEIYSKPLFTSPALEFTSTTISSTLAIGTTQIKTITEIKYDEEIERLKEELREKERELEERKKILLEREERLERDIIEFERYVKEFEKKKTSITPLEKSTVLTSLSTPVPPTEKTTTKAQLTTQTKRVIEKKENRTTTKMVTSRYTEIKEIEEKKWTKPVFEKTVTQKEEDEIATKRICLNVLENTTIPLDKKRRNIVTKKICLPYFPEKNKESVGRLSRRLLALQNTKKIRRPRGNVLSNFRDRRRVKETTRKIDNLQLSYHEWLSNESTKPLQHFKGFTRIYKKMRKFRKNIATIIDTQRNTTSDFRGKTPLYERVLEHHESFFQPTATSTMDSKKYGKRNTFFRHNLIFARKSDLPIDDKANVRKRDVSPIENNAQFRSRISTANISNKKTTTAIAEKNGAYTVNVLHLNYNEDKQTHEIISAKPDEDELTAILSESNDIYVTEFGEDRKITTPYYEIEEKDDELSDEMEKRMEEDDEYIEDMIENYMNYEEHETSTRTHERFLDRSKDKRTTENERELLNQAWPTERSTTYHLGGTRFWELDFVTEPSVLRTTTKKSKTIGVSITRTTCFDVVLQNERNDEIKSNVFYRKRNIYNNGMKQHIPIKKRNVSLKNVTRNKINALRYKLKTKFYEPKVAKKLKRNSQKLHESNSYKRAFEEKETIRFNDFWRTSNKDLITAKSRKLCVVNANKLKRQIIKHKDVTNKHKKKQKSQTSQNINLHILHNTDNCVVSTKNKYHKTTTKSLNQVKSTADKNEKVTHSKMIDHKNKSTSASHEKKIHNCFNCICDIVTVVNNIRSLLDRKNFPLDEIKTLNCSEYKDIQDKIVISMDADMEEAREFSQPHYNTESLKGQKYIKLEELEDNFKSDSELDSDHDVISLPGLNLNLPCNQDGNGITWLSSVSRPSYTWKRTDGIALFGFVAENGDLELRNVNAKDTGNYTCIMTYMSPDNEEPVETVYEIHLQVVTLPRYIVHGENRYRVRSCDEGDLDVLITYLPIKLNSVICEADVCNAYVLTPSCSRSQITINILLVPSHIIKLMTIDPKHCNVFCLKAIQDKLSLILSKNLQIFLGKTIIFRLPHYEQRLVPIVEKSSFARRKRGKTDANAFAGRSSNIGLFSSCPAGYGLRETRCVPCNVGTYSEDGISHCKRCPPGTFQPNHGARVCRTCTNPMTKGCYNMLWNSFSAVMVTLASVGAMLSICLLLVWIICCAKKKFFVKRIAGLTVKQDMFEEKHPMEEQPLIKDASENEDQQWDSEYIVKKKKGKFHVNKKRRKQNESRKYDKAHLHEDEWGSHRIKNAPVISPDSYRSHEDYNNHYLKRSHRKGPRLPECDFDT
ncbi:PREDICTED: uncharacterized protein LOC105451173 isoform X2 [Wasmannia auropunctata]|uniref:uncharacterized protein LOC105451173 isoform X2 n=1 Tax=Wasmannia auropunctata TaxID=64793 RepID=UPI0005EECB74|nr:PREDICTED: uncharacterized protein LOC105451173 isoform X2 [Wasmannia auropunctata]